MQKQTSYYADFRNRYNMKKKILAGLITTLAIGMHTTAQTVVVTDDNSYVTGQASSVLDVKSTSKGFLAPRMTLAQRTAISGPADGLLVYQTDGIKGFYYYNASGWTMIDAGGSSQWTSSGNNIYYNSGNVGIGVNNPGVQLTVKDTLEIRRVGSMSQLLFSNTSGTGDMRIAGDGGDIFWQGGGARNLQMGAYWGIILAGDRQSATIPAFSAGVANTNVLALAQRDGSVPLAVQGYSATQSANLMEWRSSSATLNVVDRNGNLGLGITAPASKLHISGTNPVTLNGVQTGAVADSLLTIASGVVRKLPLSGTVSSIAWSTSGNSGTNPGVNFIGNTDNKSLRFKTNNIQRVIMDSLGNVGIGTAPAFTAGTFQEKLLVDAGTTSSYNAIVARGSINNYFQLNIQNQSNGANASSDIVATADNGTEIINFIDMGINSSANTQGIMGGAGDGYLYTTGNNLLIGTGTVAKSLVFMTGGTSQSTNERMRIDGTGNVGVGVTTPTAVLHLAAGDATAGNAPLKFTAGTVLTTPESGAVEFDGTNYYVTTSGVRYTLAKTLTATANLNFAATAGMSSRDMTITVNGATDGDVVQLGVANAAAAANSAYTAFVSAANTVTIRFHNYTLLAIDPAAGNFRVSVTKY